MSALDNVIKRQEQYDGRTAGGRDAKAARAELTALRAQANMLDDYAATIQAHEITIAEQARRLEEARQAIKPFAEIPCLENFDDDQLYDEPILAGDVRAARAWLAANAPQEQTE